MGVDQRTGEGSKPRIPRVVSKPNSNHGTATTAHRTLGLTPAGTICRSNLSLSYYPILNVVFLRARTDTISANDKESRVSLFYC